MKILEKCKKAITGSKDKKGGKLIVIDMILDGKMMTCLTGKERSEKEWAEIFLLLASNLTRFIQFEGCEVCD